MASLLFKDKKGVNLSCASPASAAVCTSLERRSMVRPSIGRAVDIYSRNPRRQRASKHQNAVKNKSDSHNNHGRKSNEKQKSAEFASPAGSSRYLLNDNSSFHIVPESDNSKAIVPAAEKKNTESEISNQEEIEVLKTCSSARQDQVVVLRVSLHCKGCEGKVRKHISKMEGVTSFEIDMATKKVTIIGNITPLRVLSSVSKVKNAQFWPSPPRASASF
ncbi:hypothetical protein KFK09_016928 [Dendrobium nobile]|uniref:HMA domain-containing protein n=1 Tax=Dendrobium nobile TaxID=94219 RepID=A0A8T3AZP3_DENNO|nr:hypothetical protein KFK09_016928 [Dendrobium nobile]